MAPHAELVARLATPTPKLIDTTLSAEKSLAIVLRVVEFSETSCIVTLYTREFGKIGALAKGARRPKSPFEAALDVLALCRIVFLQKSSDALDLLTEAKLQRRFRAASRDLSRLYAGYYVAELLNDFTDKSDPHPELFDWANQTIQALDSDGDPMQSVMLFELFALLELGHWPSLSTCVGCGCEVKPVRDRYNFGLAVGGVICPICRAGKKQIVSLSGDTFRALCDIENTMTASTVAGDNGAAANGHQTTTQNTNGQQEAVDPISPIPPNYAESLAIVSQLSPRNLGELRGIVSIYVSHLLGKRPKMHAYFQSAGRGRASKISLS